MALCVHVHWVSVVIEALFSETHAFYAMLLEVTVIAEENLTKSKIFLSFLVFVYFCKKQEWIPKKKSAKTLPCSLASLYSLIRQYKSMNVRYSLQCSSLEYGHVESAL